MYELDGNLPSGWFIALSGLHGRYSGEEQTPKMRPSKPSLPSCARLQAIEVMRPSRPGLNASRFVCVSGPPERIDGALSTPVFPSRG